MSTNSEEGGLLRKWLSNLQTFIPFLQCYPMMKRTQVNQTTHKDTSDRIEEIFDTLKQGVSRVYKYPKLSQQKSMEVNYKLKLLEEQLKKLSFLSYKLENGAQFEQSDLILRCRNLNTLIDCIRDDVFEAYLSLSPEQKIALHKHNRQMSCIFSVLGILEKEVYAVMKTVKQEESTNTLKPLLKPDFPYKKIAKKVAHVLKDEAVKEYYNKDIDDSCNYCKKSIVKDLVDQGTDPITFPMLATASPPQQVETEKEFCFFTPQIDSALHIDEIQALKHLDTKGKNYFTNIFLCDSQESTIYLSPDDSQDLILSESSGIDSYTTLDSFDLGEILTKSSQSKLDSSKGNSATEGPESIWRITAQKLINEQHEFVFKSNLFKRRK